MVNKSMLFGAVAACGLGLSTELHAEEHMVVVTGFSYFPETIYVKPGDTVLFINKSGSDQIIVGRGGDWVVGPIANEEESALKITRDTALDYYSAYEDAELHKTGGRIELAPGEDPAVASSFGRYEQAPIRALISFAPPPLG